MLSRNKAIPWDKTLIERFVYKWRWYELSNNIALPWDISFIQYFVNRWSFSGISPEPWEWEKRFQPYVTDSVIEHVMIEILPQIWNQIDEIDNLNTGYQESNDHYYDSEENYCVGEDIAEDWEILGMDPNSSQDEIDDMWENQM